MTYDLIRNFESYFKTIDVLLDTYSLSDGFYYICKKDGTLKKLIIKNGEASDYELLKYVKVRDFYSKCINSDKAINTQMKDIKEYKTRKKIFSNNIYTLFFKNKYVLGFCNENFENEAVPITVFEKGIEKYYDSLLKLGIKKDEKILLQKGYEIDEIVENKRKMLNAVNNVLMEFKSEDKPKETWIKIFLEQDEDEYKRVSSIYYTLKLFNTNDNNIELNNNVYGVNNYNFGLNSKKPFLELKSTPYKVSSLISKDQIEILNNIYVWLYNNGVSKNVLKLPLDWNFEGTPETKDDILNKDMYLVKVVGNNGVARIDDFQYISNYTSNINEFICKDYIKKKGDTYKIGNIYKLEKYTSDIWFSNNLKSEKNYLRDSYYDYDNKIAKCMLSLWKKEILKNEIDIFFGLFQKEDETNFYNNLDNIATKIVENTLIEDLEKNKKQLYNSINSMNLWIAFKCYFNREGEDEEMKINDVQRQCSDIFLNNGKIETDEQYYYFAGQVAFYLLNISKATKLTQDVTSPFIKAANLKKLKTELKFLYEKYNYDIYLNNPKFNNIMSQLLLNEPEVSVKDSKDIILAGILGNNVFYTKKELGGNENGENE